MEEIKMQKNVSISPDKAKKSAKKVWRNQRICVTLQCQNVIRGRETAMPLAFVARFSSWTFLTHNEDIAPKVMSSIFL